MSQPKPHKHAALIRQWAELVAKGEVAADWWSLKTPDADRSWFRVTPPDWSASEYEITKSYKHPDNAKPALDWSKVPIGAMTNEGVFVGVSKNGNPMTLLHNPPIVCAWGDSLALTPMQMWFDGEPTQEQRDMFEIEAVQMVGLNWSKTKIWRIKGARK